MLLPHPQRLFLHEVKRSKLDLDGQRWILVPFSLSLGDVLLDRPGGIRIEVTAAPQLQ